MLLSGVSSSTQLTPYFAAAPSAAVKPMYISFSMALLLVSVHRARAYSAEKGEPFRPTLRVPPRPSSNVYITQKPTYSSCILFWGARKKYFRLN